MTFMPCMRAAWALSTIGILALLCGSVRAQTDSAPEVSTGDRFVGRYVISQGPEDLLRIDVQVWGQVNRPGQYLVPDRTDLIGLISYAGGPTEDAKLEKVRIVRPLAGTDRVAKVDIEEFLRTGDRSLIPEMTPGDVVVVPASGSHRIARLAGFVSVAALVANVAILATRN